MVIEALSPSTAGKDRIAKRRRYQNAGVAEYWIVDIRDAVVEVLTLKDGEYVSKLYLSDEVIPVSIIPDFELDLDEIFPTGYTV